MKATPEQIEKLKQAATKAGTGSGNLVAVIRQLFGAVDRTDPFAKLTGEQAQRLIDMFDAKRITDAAYEAVDEAEEGMMKALDGIEGLMTPENPQARYLGSHEGSDGATWHRVALAEGNKLNVSIRRPRES